VRSLVELMLVAEHRRGHGAMYDALGHGRVEPSRLRRTLASVLPPVAADGRIMLAVDVSPWPAMSTAGEEHRLADSGLALLLRHRPGDGPAPRGPRCWTRSVSARPITPPRSPST
jgi:DDE superfamily endonuclease